MKSPVQFMAIAEKVFLFLEELPEFIQVSLTVGADLVRKSLIKHFANFGVGLRINEASHNRLFCLSDVGDAMSFNRWWLNPFKKRTTS
jgi:hypothetical protein